MEMTFYVTTNEDGTIHITNTVGSLIGQHHVHTPKDFKTWLQPDYNVSRLKNTKDCDCLKTVRGAAHEKDK